MEFKESIGFRKSKTTEKEQLEKEPKEKTLTAEAAKEIPEIRNKEIAELEEPMKKILQGMSKQIDKGEYRVILGEDSSGRLPALLFRQILKTLYEEKGFSSPETLFFAGQRFNDFVQKEKVVEDFANFIKKSGAKEIAKNKKILVVTEAIQTGINLFPFTNTLRAMKINFDIATIGLPGGGEGSEQLLEKHLGGKIFWGMECTPRVFYREHPISGVKKSAEPTLFAELYPRSREGKDNKKYYSQRRAARQDIKILAEKLVQWYKEKKF